MDNYLPTDLYMIKDLEAAKAIADPLRLQILEVLIPAPLTVKQIAERLGLGASKLYYHVKTLEKFGLIRVVGTHVIGNIIEKEYWITAYNYSVNQDIYNFDVQDNESKQNIISMVLTTLDTVREDFVRSIEARAYNLEHGAEQQPRNVVTFREICRVPDEKIEAFQTRLRALLNEFETLDEPENTDIQPWAFTVLFYPTFYFDQPESNE